MNKSKSLCLGARKRTAGITVRETVVIENAVEDVVVVDDKEEEQTMEEAVLIDREEIYRRCNHRSTT